MKIYVVQLEELNSMQNNNIENNQLNQNNTYTLECNHKYHSSCIIKWFRSGRNNCHCVMTLIRY